MTCCGTYHDVGGLSGHHLIALHDFFQKVPDAVGVLRADDEIHFREPRGDLLALLLRHTACDGMAQAAERPT